MERWNLEIQKLDADVKADIDRSPNIYMEAYSLLIDDGKGSSFDDFN